MLRERERLNLNEEGTEPEDFPEGDCDPNFEEELKPTTQDLEEIEAEKDLTEEISGPAVDIVSLYLQEIAQTPLLTAADE